MNIYPGRGIDNILFGCPPDDVVKILGPPKKKEETRNQYESYVTFYYDEGKLRFSFDDEHEGKLSEISSETNKTLFFQNEIIGLSKSALFALFQELDISDPTISNTAESDNQIHELLELDELAVTIWLENDEVVEIQWGPFWIDENRIDWPDN